MEFKHPKYYKELRKLRNKLDQAISHANSTRGPSDVRPDPGLKLPGPSPISNANKGLIHKRQASSPKLLKHQATSIKPQAASVKLKPASVKLHDPKTTKKFHGTRTKGLCYDKCIVWMLHMEGYLVW